MAVDRDHRLSYVSSIISPSSTPVTVPAYLSAARIAKISEILNLVANLRRNNTSQAKFTLVRKRLKCTRPRMHLTPTGPEVVQRCTLLVHTPYGLAVKLPAHDDSIAYLVRKGNCIVQQPEALSGLIDLKKPESHNNNYGTSTSCYAFENCTHQCIC